MPRDGLSVIDVSSSVMSVTSVERALRASAVGCIRLAPHMLVPNRVSEHVVQLLGRAWCDAGNDASVQLESVDLSAGAAIQTAFHRMVRLNRTHRILSQA